MLLLNASQVKGWDQYTIQQEPISSINLMERAATACARWIGQHFPGYSFDIFCGTGNNGGDGLAIARLLALENFAVRVFIINTGAQKSEDFLTNLTRLHTISSVNIIELNTTTQLPDPATATVIIDALLGTGLNRPVAGFTATVINHINALLSKVIAIDMPTGLPGESDPGNASIVEAIYTLTFQNFKLALLLPGNARFFGQVELLDIGLHPGYLTTVESHYETIDATLHHSLYIPRSNYAHKGNFGHALILAGSYGKMGAAVLSTRACLRSGAGLVTAHVPGKGIDIMQTSAPEAMCQADPDNMVLSAIDYPLKAYAAIGMGPGIGHHPSTKALVRFVLNHYNKPLVLDADALNILSENKSWFDLLTPNSILTPHPKEFSRLFGEQSNDFDRIKTALEQSVRLNVIIILKGHRTFIATPAGKGYFNTTGNAGMATGGSGDVLTGIITSLLAQGYAPAEAAIMGVYLHGLAGDKAAAIYGMEAMIAGDLVENIRFPD